MTDDDARAQDGPGLTDLLREALQPLQLLEREAAGGMGEIYLARDTRLSRTVAVKVLHSDLVADEASLTRFFREARVIAGLSHPNIIDVYSVGDLPDGTPYFVMDFVDGGNLADRVVAEGPMDLPSVRRILGEVASALEAAHAQGVIHRDIKAANILYDSDSGRAIVTDWGIAGLDPHSEMSPDARVTQVGVSLGSPQYMSPEQLAGDEVGPESDVYSLGLLAFELLSDEGPYEGETPREIMISHLRDDPKPLSRVRPDVDPEVESLVMRCLSKEPHERPRATELAKLAPGLGILEWPPPGLAGLHGKAERLGIWLAPPVAVIMAPLLIWIASAGSDWGDFAQQGNRGLVLAAAAVGVALLALVGMSAKLSKFGIQVFRAGRLGYGWRTIAEVISDMEGDTGRLISGAREYAVLSQKQRRRMRFRRMYEALLWPLGAIFLLPAAALITVATFPAWWSLGLSLAAIVAGARLPLEVVRVPRALKKARKKFRKSAATGASLGPIVDAWHRTVGAGRFGGLRPRVGRWVGPVALAVLFLFAVVTTSTVAVVLLPASLASASFPGSFRATLGLWEEVAGSASLRVPPVAVVSPQAAGRLVRAILANDSGEPPSSDRPTAASIEGSSLLLDGSLRFSEPFQLRGDSVMELALIGLGQAEVTYLRGFEANPGVAQLDTLAGASGLDWWASDPTPGRNDYLRPGIPVGPIREAGWATAAYAAALAAEGDYTGAEDVLRRLASAGFVLTEGPRFGSARVGMEMISRATHDLLAVFQATGRAADFQSLQPAVASPGTADSTSADDVASNRTSPTNEERFEALREAVSDSTLPRGLRWAAASELLLSGECVGLRSIFLGATSGDSVFVAEQRHSLVIYPSEDDHFQQILAPTLPLFSFIPDSIPLIRRSPETSRPRRERIVRLMHVIARVTGNPRISTCSAIFLLRSFD